MFALGPEGCVTARRSPLLTGVCVRCWAVGAVTLVVSSSSLSLSECDHGRRRCCVSTCGVVVVVGGESAAARDGTPGDVGSSATTLSSVNPSTASPDGLSSGRARSVGRLSTGSEPPVFPAIAEAGATVSEVASLPAVAEAGATGSGVASVVCVAASSAGAARLGAAVVAPDALGSGSRRCERVCTTRGSTVMVVIPEYVYSGNRSVDRCGTIVMVMLLDGRRLDRIGRSVETTLVALSLTDCCET